MICVTVGLSRHTLMIEHHRQVVEAGAQLVELRLDQIKTAVKLDRLTKDRAGPVVITCRRTQEGGAWSDTEDKRILLLRSAIAQNVDYVDLEEDVAGSIPRFGKTKRIVSYTNLQETPADLEAIHARAKSKNADVVRLTTLAKSPQDVVRMLELTRASDVPTVGICTGDHGLPTAILAHKFGAPFTFGTFHSKRPFYEHQPSFHELKGTYHYERITADTEVFGSVGDPLDDSPRSAVFNASFHYAQMNRVFVPFRARPEDFKSFVAACPSLGIKGLCVLGPHRHDAMNCATKTEKPAQETEEADTLVFSTDATLGYNVLTHTASDCVTAALGAASSEGTVDPLTGKLCVVLGAGSAARAVAHCLRQRGAEVAISGRVDEKAQSLALAVGGKAVAWASRQAADPGVVVNCTPVGMHPHVNESPYPAEGLARSSIVMDLVYNPEQTLLIKAAKQLGCRVVTGVDTFIRQAALQYKTFTGEKPPVEVMRQTLKKLYGAVKF